jgi:hypothetical protein
MINRSHRKYLQGAACLFLIAVGSADGGELPKLRVSDNQRVLVLSASPHD